MATTAISSTSVTPRRHLSLRITFTYITTPALGQIRGARLDVEQARAVPPSARPPA
jgi:hypothetical protein